ncbi:hypothetical protein [Caballeronia sp. HLA56]
MEYSYETIRERAWVAVNRCIGEANGDGESSLAARQRLETASAVVTGFSVLTYDAPSSHADKYDMLGQISRARKQLRERFGEDSYPGAHARRP